MSCPGKPVNKGPCADKTQAGRIRRLKGKTNSDFFTNNPQKRSGLDYATLYSINEGSRTHYVDETLTDYGCCHIDAAVPSAPSIRVASPGHGEIALAWASTGMVDPPF